MTVPSNLIPFRITQLPVDPSPSVTGILMYVRDGVSYQVTADQIVSVTGVPTTRQVIAGTGLTGGGQLLNNVTLSVAPGGIGTTELANTGVTPGVYGGATDIPVLTIDSTGRVTAATTSPFSITGFVPTTRQVIAGTGLNGGGTLASNVTLNANLSNATPEPVDTTGSAGVSNDMSRADHKHPAIDLSDDDQVDNILGLGNGGTARSIVPDAGAVVWSGADGFYLTQVGANGLVLTSSGTGAPTWTTAGIGTVLSVGVSGGSTGLTTSGGPIVNSGVITLGGVLNTSAGGTGLNSTPTNGQLLIGDGAGFALSVLTAGSGVSITNATGSITIANTNQDQTVTITDGTAISVTGTYPSFTISNTAPDQTVVLTDGGNIAVSGTYPSFTLTNSAPNQTVTITDGTNISITGTYPSFTISSPNTVVGPAGATSGAISLFDGGTGKLIKNSVITISSTGVISNVATPIVGNDAANKQYVDDLVSSGIHIHTPVVLATSPGSSRTDTYNNGTAGVSATLTSVAAGTLVIDGTVASATIRVLIQDCSNPIGNGVYVVTNAGDISTQYEMMRASDADTAGQQSTQSLDDGSYFFTTGGTSNKGAAWVNTNSGTIDFGSTAITFAEFSVSQVYSAGTGLDLTGTVFSLQTPVSVLNGGTGKSSAATNGQLLIGTGSGFELSTLTAGTAISVTNATGSITIANTAPDQTVVLTNGTAISVTGTYPSFTVTNTLPDQTVVLNQAGGVTITGTYPSFTISSTSSGGTVTSIDASSTVSGFAFTGGPVSTSGILTLGGTLAISNGGTGASTQSGARTALGLGTMATQDANNVSITGGSIGSSVLVDLTNATGNISGGTY